MTATLDTSITDQQLDLLAHELAQAQTKTPNLRRNGKIARLPKKTRDMLNHMLDDGLPYQVIIEELGDAGKGLNLQNLSNWLQGGYQDYLDRQEALERSRAQIEFAVRILREFGEVDLAQVRRACSYVAALQLFEALRDNGDQALKNLFQTHPRSFLKVAHTLCHQSNSALQVEKHRFKQQQFAARTASQSSPIKPAQGPAGDSSNSDHPPVLESPLDHAGAAPSEIQSSPIKPNQAPARNSANLQSSILPLPNPLPPSNPIKPNQALPENLTVPPSETKTQNPKAAGLAFADAILSALTALQNLNSKNPSAGVNP